MNKIKKIAKIILWIVGSIIGLIFLLMIALQIPFVQNYVKDKAVSYLENKIKTKVEIGSIEIGLPKKVILTDFYFEDQSGDTLLSGKKIDVDVSLIKLLRNSIEINQVNLDGITAKIDKDKDSVYNFDYIITAFSSPDKKETSQPMKIKIDGVTITNTKFYYNDVIHKNDVTLKVIQFETNFKAFNLDSLQFDIPEIKLTGLQLKLNQGVVESVDKVNTKIKEETAKQSVDLKLKHIDLSQIEVTYNDKNSKIDTQIAFEKLETQITDFDWNQRYLHCSELLFKNTKGVFNLGKNESRNIVQNTTKQDSDWKIVLEKVELKKINYAFHNHATIKTKKGFDFNHINVQNFNFKGNDLVYSTDAISGTISELHFYEKSGLTIQECSAQFQYSKKNAFLKNLKLITPQTQFKNENIHLSYPSIASITSHPEKIKVNTNFSNSTLGIQDVLLIVPKLANQSPFKEYSNHHVLFTARANGSLANLIINQFTLSGIGNTKINTKGTITGLPKMDEAYFDLNILQLESTASDMKNLLPNGTIPTSISLPEQFAATGNFKGTMQNFNTSIDLKSSYGNAIVEASFNQQEKENEQYALNASLQEFYIGKLIQNKALGKVSVKTNVKGSSLNPKKANATATIEVLSAKYNDYEYKNIVVDGTLQKGTFTVTSQSSDPNLTYNLETTGDFDGKYPKAKLNLTIDLIDLNKLNLHAGPLKMRGDVMADFETLAIDNLNGHFQATNFLVALEKEQFPLDTISLRSVATAEKDSIILKSQFANATFHGNYQLSSLVSDVQESISNYIDLHSNSKPQNNNNNNPQILNFEINIKEEEILKKIVPNLEEMEAISIIGAYNSLTDSIALKATIPNIKYAGTEIIATQFSVDKKEKGLRYNTQIGTIKNNDFTIPKTKLSGKIENNTLTYQASIVDAKEIEKYAISGDYITKENISEIKINPENLVLNYNKWNIAAENTIKISSSGIHISDFILSKEGNELKIQSETDSFSAPIQIDLKDFELQSVTNIISSNYEFGGTANGVTTIENNNSSPTFMADVAIANFTFKKDTIGNLSVKIDNKIANTYSANIALTGKNNEVAITGDYKKDIETLHFQINLDRLQMHSLQPFTSENLKESEGYLNGKLLVTGKASNPNINGSLKFNNVGFIVAPLNSKFKLINDKIDFNSNLISFKTFRFKDENDNDLEINGTVNSNDYTNPEFNLNIIAKNFKAINSKANDNELFYGTLFLDNNINLKGTLESPIVNGNIKINKDTEFTIVLPQEDPSIADREGIVTFVDQDQPVLITVEDSLKQITETDVKGIDASATIEIDKDAEISIIIDKANGDFLKLKGEAKLTGGIDPSGKTTLTGKYEFTDGSYEMNFNLIKRKFDIKPGSYILWTGEPTSANVSVTAIYKSDIAPIDLVNDQLGTASTDERNTYKQKISFETQLKMSGELMQPEIQFDIVLPDGNNDVSNEVISTTQAKLEQIRQQEDVLNKQVFAVLLLNRFIGENPFQSESGGLSAGYLAKQSASRILSEQLNQIAGDLIDGFQIDFDLEATEDYTTGQKQDRTDLNIGVTKELLDDRLKISIGSSFGVEGTPNENEQANTIAGDLSAEYLLTKDGRYKLKAYRKNNYQVALQGQVIETGVAFIITMNYDKFKELFQKNKDKKQ
ncbi:translocation/assembly module TamB [Flavobacterium sp. J27]|uniref:translocation/assembly module TamB domain-containing protein n=1 Tax=Flavobacterium sp. J27 TaxID=2060419 RepID=UPI00102F334F|nr:translocation/assembly module TamB [Flavobacterium sp. J27]